MFKRNLYSLPWVPYPGLQVQKKTSALPEARPDLGTQDPSNHRGDTLLDQKTNYSLEHLAT